MRMSSIRTPILSVVVAGAFAAIASCTTESTAPRTDSAADSLVTLQKVEVLRSKYEWIGEYHTNGLKQIYRALARNGDQIHGRSDACRIAARALKEFHRTARKGEVPFGLVDPAIAGEVCGDAGDTRPIRSSVLQSSLLRGFRTSELSAPAINYVNQVVAAVQNATSRTMLVGSLSSIRYASAATLSFAEAGAVSGVASVAITSADYWESNLSAWVQLPSTRPIQYYMGSVGGVPVPANTMSAAPAARYSAGPFSWWYNPYVRNYVKVVAADAGAAARVIYTTWHLGPIGWDAAAAAALWVSTGAVLALIY